MTDIEQETVTRAASAKTSKTTTSAKKKTTSTTKKKTSTSSNTMRLSAAEKELIRNYRKCNSIEKKLVAGLAEKVAGGIDYNAILNTLLGQLKK